MTHFIEFPYERSKPNGKDDKITINVGEIKAIIPQAGAAKSNNKGSTTIVVDQSTSYSVNMSYKKVLKKILTLNECFIKMVETEDEQE